MNNTSHLEIREEIALQAVVSRIESIKSPEQILRILRATCIACEQPETEQSEACVKAINEAMSKIINSGVKRTW